MKATTTRVVNFTPTPKFPLGQIVSTPAAIEFLADNDRANAGAALSQKLLGRHQSGDWGDMGDEDKRTNDGSLGAGEDAGRIFSSYNVGDGKVWIITEYDRSVTTILLPSDY